MATHEGLPLEIQLNLDDDFELQGLVKPGSDLAAIMHTFNTDTVFF